MLVGSGGRSCPVGSAKPLCCLHGGLLGIVSPMGCGCWAGVTPAWLGPHVSPTSAQHLAPSARMSPCPALGLWLMSGGLLGGASPRAGRRGLHLPAELCPTCSSPTCRPPPSFPLSPSRPTSSAAPSGRSASADRAPRRPRILPRRCSSHPSSPSTLSRQDSSWQPLGSPFPPPATPPRGTRPPLSRCCSPRATFSLPSK